MEDIKQIIKEVSPFILLAMTGGLAKLLTSEKELNIYKFLSALFVAGFVGAMTGFLLETAPLHQGLKFFLAGSSGLAGGTLIEIYENKVIKQLRKLGK